MRETLALEMPISAAMCSWVRRSRRKFSTASAVASGIWPGDESGLEDRSRKPSTPSAQKRSTHLPTVFGGRIELVRSRGFGHAAIRNGTHHFLSTFRGQASILMGVHSVLRESLRFGNIRVPGLDRMGNLPKVHS